MLGLDLGARFVRGAVCDVRGEIRARQDVELPERTAAASLDAIDAARGVARCWRPARRPERVDGVVLGVPGAVDVARAASRSRTNVSGLEGDGFARGARGAARPRGDDRERHQPRRARRALARRRARRRRLRVPLDRHRPRRRARAARRAPPRPQRLRRRARLRARRPEPRTSTRARRRSRPLFAARPRCARRRRPARDLRRRARGRPGRARVVEEEAAASRCTSCRSRPSPTSGSSCSAAGSARTATCSTTAFARCSRVAADPPRVEASSLGDAAVLTGALAVGLRAARENVFVNRARGHSDRRASESCRGRGF